MRKISSAIIASLKLMIDQTVNALKHYKQFPTQNLCVIFSSAGCLVSMVGVIIAFISFIARGGYLNQIKAIKETGVNEAFTRGNVAMLSDGVIGSIAMMCIVAGLVFLIITFFQNTYSVKRILMLIDLGSLVLSVGITAFYDAIISRKFNFTDEQLNVLRDFFSIVDYMLIIKILVGILCFEIICFFLLFIFSDLKSLFSHIIKAAIVSFVAAPLFLLLIENFIALIATVILGVGLIIALYVIGGVLKEAGGSGSADGGKPTQIKHKEKKVDNAPKVKEIASGYRLYIDEGHGIGAPMSTCIFVETAVSKRSYVCTLKDFQDGKVIIKKGGVPIKNIK